MYLLMYVLCFAFFLPRTFAKYLLREHSRSLLTDRRETEANNSKRLCQMNIKQENVVSPT